jgi:hypothetical protein
MYAWLGCYPHFPTAFCCCCCMSICWPVCLTRLLSPLSHCFLLLLLYVYMLACMLD